MTAPPLNYRLVSLHQVFIFGLAMLVGCCGCSGSSGSGGVSPDTNFSVITAPDGATRDVELKAIGSRLPTLEPYWGDEYTGMIPQNWQASYNAENNNLFVQPLPSSGLQYANDPLLASRIAINRFERGDAYNPYRLVTEMETSFSEVNHFTLRLLGQSSLVQGGVARVLQYTESGIDSRLVVIASPDPNDERYATSALLHSTSADFESFGGADLLSVLIGSVRRAEEVPALEVGGEQGIQNAQIPGIEGTGLTEADITLELKVLEYAVGRSLTELEKNRLIEATVRMAAQKGKEWTARNLAILTPFFETLLRNAAQAQGNDYQPFLRWLIKNYLLDMFYRTNPLEYGSSLMIRLLSESHHAAAPEGQPQAFDLRLAGLESLSAPEAVAVQGINLDKLYRAPLIQSTWQRIVDFEEHPGYDDIVQQVLMRYRNAFTLPPGRQAHAVVKSYMPQGEDLLSVLGSAGERDSIVAPFRAREVDLQTVFGDGGLYLDATATGQSVEQTAALRFMPWGHVMGNAQQLRNLSDTLPVVGDAQVPQNMPLIRIRAQEAWPILSAGAQLGWLPRLTLADEHLAALVDYLDFELDVDETFRFRITFDFPNEIVAQAAQAYYETIYAFQTTRLRIDQRFALWDHLVWQRQGSRLEARVILSPQASQEFFTQLERDASTNFNQILINQLLLQNYFINSMFNYLNFEFSTGFALMGLHEWAGTSYSDLFVGVLY